MKKGDWVAVDEWDDVEHFAYQILGEFSSSFKLYCPEADCPYDQSRWVDKVKVRLMTDEEKIFHNIREEK